ncbi:hypothetical protein Lal_00049750 [Lupinus albus]|nr:hypothetical protein Lal_00049750 [Lupinus albus]
MEDKDVLDNLLSHNIQALRQEGIVDDYFLSLYSMKEHSGDSFTLDVITSFCTVARDCLQILAQLLDEPVLNHQRMEEYIFKVKGSSLSVGAYRVAQAFSNFQRIFQAGASKEECLKALNRAEEEYSSVEGKFHACIEESTPCKGQSWSEQFNFGGSAMNGDAAFDSSIELKRKLESKDQYFID